MDNNKCDLAIVGCGPAGLSAALNAKIRNKNFLLLGTTFCASKTHVSPWVDNFLGEDHISGSDLRQKFLKHIQAMGIEINTCRVNGIYQTEGGFDILCPGWTVSARAVIVAVGVEYGLKLAGEEEFLGKGISYCATCDGPLYRGKSVTALVYSRDSLDEIIYLSETCREVVLFPLFPGALPDLPANVVINHAKPQKIDGNTTADRVITDGGTVITDGIFIFREALPPGQLVPGVETEEGGIRVNKNMETSLKGLYAAGDCTGKPYQLAKAVGEGQVAALNAIQYLDRI